MAVNSRLVRCILIVCCMLLSCYALHAREILINKSLFANPEGSISLNNAFYVTTSSGIKDSLDTKINLTNNSLWAEILESDKLTFSATLNVDSTVAHLPLALQLSHNGASEIYLDGYLIKTFGNTSKDKPVYYNPQDLPVSFSVTEGRHLLQLVYANYDAAKNYNKYQELNPGITAKLGFATQLMHEDHNTAVFYSTSCFFIVGIFMALAIAHFFLYVYFKAQQSNLYFSLFCVCMGASFLIPYLNKVSHSVSAIHLNLYLEIVFKGLFCIALSGFINSLFSNGVFRHRLLTFLSLLIVVLAVFFPPIAEATLGVLLLIVCIESGILTIIAIRKKVPGARVLGVGFILFVVFLLTFSIIKIKLHISDADIAMQPSGRLIMILIIGSVLIMPVSMAIFLAFQFAQLNKSLVKTNHRLRELISYNAHQMREPLTRITGALAIKEMFEDPQDFSTEILPLLEKAAKDLDTALVDVLNKVQEE